MKSRAVVVGMFVLLSTPLRAGAECFALTAQHVMAEKGIALVFSGTVRDIVTTAKSDKMPDGGGYRVVFDVDRVWKGSMPGRFDLYVSSASAEAPRFSKEQRYVVLAAHLTDPRTRQRVGLGSSEKAEAFIALDCQDALAPNIREQLGAGYPPRGKRVSG
jgi:hypothetical protein